MSSPGDVTTGRAVRLQWVRDHYLQLGALLAALLIVGLAVALRDQLPSAVGYPAVLLLSFLASASVVVPLPGLAALCTAAGPVGLLPLAVGLVAALGESAGEITGYMVGFSGRGVVERKRLYLRMEPWMQRHGWVVLFVLSVIPNPLFDLAGISAGALRFPLWRFLGVVIVGKLIKSVGIAYACASLYDRMQDVVPFF